MNSRSDIKKNTEFELTFTLQKYEKGEEQMRIFLSHSSKDKQFVEKLAKDILALDVEVWLDKWEIKVGDSLLDKIGEGLESSDYLIIILSNNSVQSSWVRKELNVFLCNEISSKKIKILPVLIDDCDIPIFLREKLYADFRDEYEIGFNVLSTFLTQAESENKIFIEKINILKGKSTENLCLDIIISNPTYRLIWATEFVLNAQIVVSGNGYSPFMYKAQYQLEMPYYLKNMPDLYTMSNVKGAIYEDSESEYYQECKGHFIYTNASSGYVWEIEIIAPVQFKLIPKDKVTLRVIFLKPQKVLRYECESGEMIGRITYGITSNRGEYKLRLDNGDTLQYEINDCEELIKFIANN